MKSVPGHAEDEARAVLGEVGLWLVEPCLHRDGALLAMQAALHGVGDINLKVALLTGRSKKKAVSRQPEWGEFSWQPLGPAIRPGPVGLTDALGGMGTGGPRGGLENPKRVRTGKIAIA